MMLDFLFSSCFTFDWRMLPSWIELSSNLEQSSLDTEEGNKKSEPFLPNDFHENSRTSFNTFEYLLIYSLSAYFND